MNGLAIFENSEFGKIRTIEENGNVLFCGSDVAKVLGYRRPNDALSLHCRYTVKHSIPHPQNPDKRIEMTFVPEGDVYRLIVHSKLPSAERFEKWVFDEVIPSIRKHGAYMTPEKIEEVLLNPDTIIRLAQEIKAEQEARRKLEAEAEVNRPKALFADSVSSSSDTILVREMAKILRQNGVKVGQNRLYQWLRENGYLIRQRGDDYNMPTQYSLEHELMTVKESTFTPADGEPKIWRTAKITGKGQLYFVNKFLAQ